MLAVATKSNIFLYETPPGERAFRFIRVSPKIIDCGKVLTFFVASATDTNGQDYYTPTQPRAITFIQQTVQDLLRKPSDTFSVPTRFQHSGSHKRSDSLATLRAAASSPGGRSNSGQFVPNYGLQRSLFVIFDKRAGWIRLSDSAVGEVDLYDGGIAYLRPQSQISVREALYPPPPVSKSRRSFESISHPPKGLWIPPVRAELPLAASHGVPPSKKSVYVLTRGKLTHILPCPLPINISVCPPIHIIHWESVPTSVTPRVCIPAGDAEYTQPVLQLVGLGEDGIEVQEIVVSTLIKGKGKARASDLVRSQLDLGGDTGFLCSGGRWDGPAFSFTRSGSVSSEATVVPHINPDSEEMRTKLRTEEGIYGWYRKGIHDWRVFWLGGSGKVGQDDW
jgi:hypothetical protein